MTALDVKINRYCSAVLLVVPTLSAQQGFKPQIPRTWDEERLATMEKPDNKRD